MAIERARAHVLPKPWGVRDLGRYSSADNASQAIGEIWFERVGAQADPSLLLKLLFTSEPLSIQVHPDDAYAHSIGLPNGKTEAWHVLEAASDARIALGVKHHLTAQQLRLAINDSSIADLVVWHAVSAGDSILVPAGTIHAIGAGLVIAEIQQRSDATFRMFDYGRSRQLHVDDAVAVGNTGPVKFRTTPSTLSEARTLLVSNAYFVFEKISLAPGSAWELRAERETWILVVNGSGRLGEIDVAIGQALFAQADRVDIEAGPAGLIALVAYTGDSAVANLLQRQRDAQKTGSSASIASRALPTDGYKEKTQ